MSAARPVCVLVAALGGQGGGVLMDWLVSAARQEGYPAQATSIAGVAQRTGATTYYFEVSAERDPKRRPVFSIYPAPGAVDLQVSFEPTEAGRALSGGFIGPETTVLTTSERIYSTAEKILPGDGTVALGPILQAIRSCAGRLDVIDMAAGVRIGRCHPNAVMFGAIAASGILPFSAETCRDAIGRSGVAVERNLAGFDAGMKMPALPAMSISEPDRSFDPPPPALVERVLALPEPVRQMAGHATARLCDYQDLAYGELYLQRLGDVARHDAADDDYRLSVSVARGLASWMAYEDVIRVAQLKTRPGRLGRIRRELGIAADVPLNVHDFLKPGSEEMLDLLPARSGRPISANTDRRGRGIALKIKTSGPFGWAMMRGLAALKPWRRHSRRYRREQDLIELWLQAVCGMAERDHDLACKLANLAVWARGYGDVRNHGLAQLDRLVGKSRHGALADKAAYDDAITTSLKAAHSESAAEAQL